MFNKLNYVPEFRLCALHQQLTCINCETLAVLYLIEEEEIHVGERCPDACKELNIGVHNRYY